MHNISKSYALFFWWEIAKSYAWFRKYAYGSYAWFPNVMPTLETN